MTDVVLSKMDNRIKFLGTVGLVFVGFMILGFMVFIENSWGYCTGLLVGLVLATLISDLKYTKELRKLYISCEEHIKEKEKNN